MYNLSSHLVGKGFKTSPHWVTTSKFGRLESSYDVLESGSYHKVLLFQTQFLSFKKLRNTVRKRGYIRLCLIMAMIWGIVKIKLLSRVKEMRGTLPIRFNLQWFPYLRFIFYIKSSLLLISFYRGQTFTSAVYKSALIPRTWKTS